MKRFNSIFNFIFVFILSLFLVSTAYSQTDYKVRLKKSDGNGGLIVIKNAASRSAAESAALADSDAGADTGAVDVEKITDDEASRRGYATETTLSTISTNLAYVSSEAADATNTSTSNLTGGSTFTGGFVDLAGYEAINVSVRVDQNSASNGLVISWSDDGTNAIITQSFTVTASTDFSELLPRRARYHKIAYTNGGTTTTQLAITTRKVPRFATTGTSNAPVIAQLATGTNSVGKVTTVPTGAPNYANGQVTTSTTEDTLLAARATRRKVIFKNLDTTDSVYIGAATVTASNGYKLGPGQEITLEITTLIQAIASANSPIVSYIEIYD